MSRDGRERPWSAPGELRSFAAGDAARLTGVRYRTLDYWARSGFLQPSAATANGKGSDRLYSFRDLVALRTAGRLRRAGVGLSAIRAVLDELARLDLGDVKGSARYLVVIGDEVARVDDTGLVGLMRRPHPLGGAAIVVQVATLIDELRDTLAE